MKFLLTIVIVLSISLICDVNLIKYFLYILAWPPVNQSSTEGLPWIKNNNSNDNPSYLYRLICSVSKLLLSTKTCIDEIRINYKIK